MRNSRATDRKRLGKILVTVLLCVSMAAVAVTVMLRVRAINGTQAAEPPETQEQNVTEAGMRYPVALANWAPAARPENCNSALLSQLTKEAAEALVARGFQSVVLPDPFTLFSAEETAKAKEVLDALGEAGVFRTLTLTPVAEERLPVFTQALGKLIEGSSFDALLLADSAAADQTGLLTTLFTSCLTQLLDSAGLSMPVIFDAGEVSKAATPYQEAVASLAGTLEKAELLMQFSASKTQELCEQAKELAGETPVSALFDLKSDIPNGTLQETVDFLSALQDVREMSLVLESAGDVAASGEAASLLQKLYQGALDLINAAKGLGLSKPFSILKSEQNYYTDKPLVNFTGTSSPLFSLTCNGKDVQRNAGGDFSVDMPLNPGKNVFTFVHRGGKYVVNVYYTVTVLESVTPRGNFETTGGIDMVVGAVARRGAAVKASLGSQNITLQPGSAENEEQPDVNSEFINYTGAFKLPASGASKQTLGTLIFTAAYQGLTDTKNGALVTLLPVPAIEPPEPETTTTTNTTEGTTTTIPLPSALPEETTTTSPDDPTTTTDPATTTSTATAPSGPLLTPYTDNKLGTAQMVEAISSHATARWNGTSDTSYNPTASPMLAGSFDYVSGKQVINSVTYYQLTSGRRLKAADVKVIDKGYKLPSNKLRATSSTATGAMVMRFGIDWKIPFNVNLIGQTYTAAQGFNGTTYGVTASAATGIEITFYHTSDYSGWVSVGSFPVMSGAEWYKDTAKNTVTLKMTLKNAGKFYGWHAYYEGSELVISLAPKPPATLKGAVIWVDPGHGGTDPGAHYVVSHTTLTDEKFVTLLIANKLKAKLEAQGATVYMSRTADKYVSPADRVRMTRQQNPDMFISVHTDSTTTESPSGTSAFYYRAFAQPLAKAVHERVVETYKKNIYISGNGISNYSTMLTKLDRGTKFYPFEVTRMEECPAILVEYGFGSNLTECKVLQTDKYQDLFAQATVDGIADWLKAQ